MNEVFPQFLDYLRPDNPVAQWIVSLLFWLFVVWLAALIWNVARNLFYRQQINRSVDARDLLVHETDARSDAALPPPEEGGKIFDAFLRAKGLSERGPIARHLRAIFEAGWNESQLDARGLIKNTSDRIFRANSLLRALLSIFIIIGLLGTLFGLADTLASLDALLHSSSQLNNDTLNLGLHRLLGNLKGAFGPSILGVLLTVSGVLLFALYLRLIALPLGGLLERVTLTVWIPQLVPTASQKLVQKMQLSRQQMERSVAAAQEVTEFAEEFQQKTSSLNQTLDLATGTLSQLARIADGLGTFSQNFIEGVKALTPFQQDLRSLYQQMVNESRAFQESVQRNIAGSEDFQRRIQEQLNSQHEQAAQLLKALQSYEQAYVASRGGIDEKLGAVLAQAEQAFQNLSKRNEEIGRALDESLGKPLRENLSEKLGAVETALQAQLGEIKNTLQVQLNTLSDRLRQLDAPLNTAAGEFTKTFSNFDEYTREWRVELQKEFAKQNETTQHQLDRLELLSEQIPQLLQKLTTSSDNFTVSSGSFAERGQQLSQNVNALTENITNLGHSVDALGAKIGPHAGDGDGRAAELLAKQTRILQELTNRVERLASVQSRSRESTVTPYLPPEPRWRTRLRNWLTFGRR